MADGFADGVVAGMATNDRNYGGNYGYGFGGGEWLWIIVLFALLGGGRFGNGFGGNNDAFPWLLASNTDNGVQAGFNQSATASALAGIQNSLVTGFSNAEVSACNRAINDLQTQYQNQIASMNQNFAMQQAFDNCCCENRLGLADLRATVLSENCSDRQAISDGIRDIIVNSNNNTQKILDTMCQDKIDAKNERIADLERQLTMANLSASQIAQTSRLLADNAAQTVALEQYLNPTPIPAYIVQNPRYYGYNNGCGCGNGYNNI